MEVLAKRVRVWGKGAITIPAKYRKALKLENDSIVTIFPVGKSLVITPERPLVLEAATDIDRAMKEKGLSLDDLLRDLRQQRKRLNQEIYGRKED